MGSKFQQLRQQLDALGYPHKLVPECVPLVEKLLLDLNTTTVNLQKYMTISQRTLEEKELLELGTEPYKCDNGKLIKECNDLHIAFIHFKEQHEKIQRELKHQISVLQMQLENCNLEKKKLIIQVQQLEKEKFQKAGSRKLNTPKDLPGLKQKSNFSLDTAMACAEERISELSRKLKDLEEKHLKLVEDNAVMKNQLITRDQEIDRLHSMIEGGRPYSAASKDCCYKNIDSQIAVLQDEITRLKKERNDLQLQLKDALAKQHEAMRRALHLVERNRQLEKEMKDVDEIALAVEAECNNTVKGNTKKVARLQDRINESLILIQNLEQNNAKLSVDLEAVKLEKVKMHKQLEKELEDKKKLTNKINAFTVIENGLNMEIDRLTTLSTEQKRKIEELESRQTDLGEGSGMSRQSADNGSLPTKQKKTCKKASKCKSPTKRPSSPINTERLAKCCCESGNCIKNLKELLDREVEYRQNHAKQSMDDLRQEKDYYMKEYHRVLEQMRNMPSYEISENGLAQLKQQLREKEQQIKRLEAEVNQLTRDKMAFVAGDKQDSCNNTTCRNRERELQIKTRELNHVEIENNTLKAKLQAINETTVFNEERMKKAFQDMEEHIRKLEDERRDLVKTELTHRSNVSHLEEDHRNLKDQLRQVHSELNNQRANYNQLKLLHEQTDRALSDAQAQAIRVETELATYKAKVSDSSRDTVAQDKEIAKLMSDVEIMKCQLTKLDREKDDLMNKLDEKTEKVALLEDELGDKNKLVARLENELKELNRKLSKYANETCSQDQIVRSKQQELNILQQDYEKERRQKEAALLENKRLQNDLSSVTCDCRDARAELEIRRREVEDLKRQLQHYVAEIKRTEDLISRKEMERNELLDQFRCLSQEANILESSNHTLETEATQSKIQLSVALDHTSELERKLDHQESVIRSYEKQIADLTTQMARLEIQLKQHALEQEQCNAEMKQMRDLCVKLDKDKDSLQHELYSKEDRRSQIQKLSEKISSEKELLQKALDQERNSLEAVEKLLDQARRDVTEQRLLNQDLQSEVSRLKQKIEELEERLTTTAKQLDIYQNKALEYSQQNKQLRRDIANERFSKARVDDKGYYPSLSTLNQRKESLAKSSIKEDAVRFHAPNNRYEPAEQYKHPTKQTSIISTKTLSQTAKFHGSDGQFCGTLGLTELNEKGSDSDLSPKALLVSTNTLMATDKFHGSDGFLDGVIDLTKIDNEAGCSREKDKIGLSDLAPNEVNKTLLESRRRSVEFDEAIFLNKRGNFDVEVNPMDPYKTSERESKSVTSTKSLNFGDPQIRRRSRGLTDLQELRKHQELLPEKENKCIHDCDKNKCKSQPPIATKGNIVTSNDRRGSTARDLPHSLCFRNVAGLQKVCRCPKCFYTLSMSEPDLLESGSCCRKNVERSGDNSKLASGKANYDVVNKTNLCSAKNCEANAKFDQNSDTSAVFRKVFSVDGVGLECRCCISSFNPNNN